MTKTKKYVIILVSEKGSEFMLDVLRELSGIEENLGGYNVFTFSDDDRTQCGLVLLSNKAEPIIIDNKDISDVFYTHTSLLEYYYGDQSDIDWIEEALNYCTKIQNPTVQQILETQQEVNDYFRKQR